jgi:processive 1,2-diacylglycerol beta-glucosyltransferase
MSIFLYRQDPDSGSREPLGAISEEQLDFLIDNLEEEFEEDEEYYINQATIDYLREQGAADELLLLLERAVAGAEEGVEIAYQYA